MVCLHTLLSKGGDLHTTLHLLGRMYDPFHRKETGRIHRRMREFVLGLHRIVSAFSSWVQDPHFEQKVILEQNGQLNFEPSTWLSYISQVLLLLHLALN